jgi:FkbM family methyltransferase
MPVSIIDCGAYTGDSIESFVRNGLIFENYFAFEPDSSNYSLLLDVIKTKNYAGIFPLRLATWSESCVIKFQKSGGNNSGARISDAVSNDIDKVLAVKLDDLFASQRIDLIKMDIEGAEKETLLGLSNTIKKNRPFLAISVYHKPEDLWEIPILIAETSKNYTFFLRTYGEQTFDTVLYCVPTTND